jgi:hypothetical protein
LPRRKAWIWCFILDFECAFYLAFILPTVVRPMSTRKKDTVDGPQDPRQRRDDASPMTTTPIVEDRCQSLRYHHRHYTSRKAAALELRPPNDDEVVSPKESSRDRHRQCRLPATAAKADQQNDRHMDSQAALSPKCTLLGSMALSMMHRLLVSFSSGSVLTPSNFGCFFLLDSGLPRIIGKWQRPSD